MQDKTGKRHSFHAPRSIARMLATALCLYGALAHAQQGPGPGPGGHEGAREGMPAHASGRAQGLQSAMLAQQMEMLQTELHLRSEQQALWQAYQDKVAALLADLARPPSVSSQPGTALRQLGMKVDQQRNRLTALEDVESAARKLYASLDEAQKEVADRMLVSTVPSMQNASDKGPDKNPDGKGPGQSERHMRRGEGKGRI